MDQQTTAMLTLERPRRLTNALRALRVLLDGAEILRLKNGDTRTTAVPAGTHTLTVQVDWMKSRPYAFSVAAGDELGLVCVADSSDLVELLKGTVGIASDALRIVRLDSAAGRALGGESPRPVVAWGGMLRRAGLWSIVVLGAGFASAIYLESTAASPEAGDRISTAIGTLTGYLLVAGLGWIAYRGYAGRTASRRFLSTNRAVLFGLLAVAALGTIAAIGVAKQRASRGQSNFVHGCVESCAKIAADPLLCEPHCGCMADSLLSGRGGVDLDEFYRASAAGAAPDPDFKRRIDAVQTACASQAQAQP